MHENSKGADQIGTFASSTARMHHGSLAVAVESESESESECMFDDDLYEAQ